VSVRLFDAYQDINSATVEVLGLSNGEADCFALVMAVTDHASFVVYHVPAIQRFVVVNMEGAIETCILACLCHVSSHEVLG